MSEVKVNKISPRTNCGTTQLGDAGDTITVTGDLKSNSIKSASGSTLTIGQSGDTVTLASGASQSGFGRTGTVDWETTKKTANFTAANGEGYFVDSSSSAITVTLPASPSAGNIVSISDYNGSATTNAITIARNGSNINGDASDINITKGDSAITFVYVDATVGWTSVQTSSTSDVKSDFIQATGGTITTSGDFKIHTFTGPGTFTVTNSGKGTPCAPANVDYLVVAGGSGGGDGSNATGGGGGAGGVRFSACTWCAPSPVSPRAGTSLPAALGAYPITVGGGAGGASPTTRAPNGTPSVFSSITSTGGGGGGSFDNPVRTGAPGGSGGGGAGDTNGPTGVNICGGAGNTPPVSPPQGNNGGYGRDCQPAYPAGGGGGAGAVGTPTPGSPSNTESPGGPGGAGLQVNIDGNNYYWGGGGGGAVWTGYSGGNGGIGGGGGGATRGIPSGSGGSGGGSAINSGGAGQSNWPSQSKGGDGGANSGGGGGGNNNSPQGESSGGSGIVIIRYKFQ